MLSTLHTSPNNRVFMPNSTAQETPGPGHYFGAGINPFPDDI